MGVRKTVHCKICKRDVGYMGWANHVRMHKNSFKRVQGRSPANWQEVLEWYNVTTDKERSALLKGRMWVKGATRLTDFD